MTTFDWNATYAKAITAFPDAPGPGLEQRLMEAFAAHPQAVTNAITKTITMYQRGEVHSPWGMLWKETERKISQEATVSGKRETGSLLKDAEQWLLEVGLHFDSWAEVEDELFGSRGLLAGKGDDEEVVGKIHARWLELRPAGEQVEWDAEERAARWKGVRARMENAAETPLDETGLRELATIRGGGDVRNVLEASP